MSETIVITVPNEFANRLQEWAAEQRVTLSDLVVDLLAEILGRKQAEEEPTLEDVVEEIIARGSNPANVIPAQGSLEEALANAPNEPPIDEEAWQREWAAVEAEMKAITRANDIAEGRGW